MNKVREFAKAFLALVFGAAPSTIVAVLALVGVHLDVPTVIAIVAGASPLLSALGVAVGPANKPKEHKAPADAHTAPAELLNSWYESNDA